MTAEPHESDGPIIRDKRRIDPKTGKVREPHTTAPSPDPAASGPETAGANGGTASQRSSDELELTLAERTADLQRLQAEYVNYKRRVDRDREVSRELATASVLTALLPALDDIGRARAHDELKGGFKAVAESLERTVTQLGLVSFGTPGDEFDPRIHEALMHSYSDEVDSAVCQSVFQVGYRFGERVLRPARVAVAEPSPKPADPDESGAAEPSTASATGEAGNPADRHDDPARDGGDDTPDHTGDAAGTAGGDERVD